MHNNKDEHGKRVFRIISFLAVCSFLVGTVIIIKAFFYSQDTFLHKSINFWTSTGLSLCAAPIMLMALYYRLRLLQHERNVEVFGVDVISNIVIITSIPYFFYLAGIRSLEGMYLFSSLLTVCLYWRVKSQFRELPTTKLIDRLPLFLIGFLIVLPIFFHVDGRIFRDAFLNFETNRLNIAPTITHFYYCSYGWDLSLKKVR